MAAFFRRLRRPAVALLVAWAGPTAISAQEAARVRVEENFRRVPNGEVLAVLEPGTPLRVLDRNGDWVHVALEGWVWTRSLQVDAREGLDLVVHADEGENIRSEPSGDVLGRLGRGTLLGEMERRPGWIRVRREGWIWGASLVDAPPAARPATATPQATDAAGPASRRPEGFVVAGAGAAVLSAPDGDTLVTASGDTELQVLSRQGNWARVRVEGWTWLPPEAAPSTGAAATEPAQGLTPADLAARPDAYRGRVVTWRLQFISLERAERVRTDFFEGEPFLLTRFGGADGPFVYVAVPQDQATALAALVPLEGLDVTGRVRTGSSSLTSTPILDLVSLARARPGR